MNEPRQEIDRGPISASIPRLDGKAKADGSAAYIADIPFPEVLIARFYRSEFTRGRIRKILLPQIPDGYHVVDHRDVPGENHVALIQNDWPAFAEEEIRYRGQVILLIAGPDPVVVDRLIRAVKVEYEPQEAAVTVDDALSLKGGPIHGEDNLFADLSLRRGDPDRAFATADRVIEGEYSTGFQEQLYLEPQGLVARPHSTNDSAHMESGHRDTIVIQGSMQCPYYVKHAVEEVMGPGFDVRVIQTVTGGGFGGKEDYPEIMGAPLAVAAWKIGKPVRMIFDRSEDLAWTSKRHPSRTRIRTAHDADGSITGFDFDIILDGGAYSSYSLIVLQRAVFTSTGAYKFPSARVRGRAVATNTVPSGAFRGFGAPQAIFALEMHMERIARELGLPPLRVRGGYFLESGDATITGGRIRGEVILHRLVERARELSEYDRKRTRYETEPWRGIGLALFNHGCGFTGDGEQRIIKAKVRIRKDEEDRVELLVASIDMGQGPQTTLRKIAGRVLGISPEEIVYRNPDTDRVPDSGPTVASRTAMVVGYLVQKAAEKLKHRWVPGRMQEAEADYTMPPELRWDQETLTGDAYATFGWGVNVVEVCVDPVTWETHVTGAWGVYDVGVALDDRVVLGQIQGGMSQALGFGALEKLEVDDGGVFMQRSMADYMVPTTLDLPRTAGETIDNPYEYGPFGAKGMGEMVHNGGHAALAAAVEQAVGRSCHGVPLTPERLLEIMSHGD
jgi:CO/xanthine dehydrogenase Mo-binding subunit